MLSLCRIEHSQECLQTNLHVRVSGIYVEVSPNLIHSSSKIHVYINGKTRSEEKYSLFIPVLHDQSALPVFEVVQSHKSLILHLIFEETW